MRTTLLNVVISLLVAACCLFAYDRLVSRPAQLLVGIVDVADVYRSKESEFAALLSAARSDEERQRAQDLATSFARALPKALAELPDECQCFVVLKSAVVGSSPRTFDLTPRLKAKLEANS
jgi:hypothetical protein